MKCFNRILVFDFGTSKTRVCENGKIVFDEPTEISYFSDGHIHIGYKARGFYSMHYDVINPIINGGVNNYDAFETYVYRVVGKLVRFPRLCLKTVVIAVPNDMIGDIETTACERALFEPFRKMGIKDIRAVPRGVALSLWVSKK
jgi:actin-like ATPase involved in cell morphogenesis